MNITEVINSSGLVLLGCGKMGSAMLKGWLDHGITLSKIHIIDPYPSEWITVLASEGLNLNTSLPKSPAVCVLAVKPQLLTDSISQVAAYGKTNTLCISIAAGITIEKLEHLLGHDAQIIRAMPNTPAAIGKGITALVGNKNISETGYHITQELLSVIGTCVRLEKEDQMDAVTAVSGSGPAYVFHFIETLAAAGVEEGLSENLAMELAIATIAGAGALAEQSKETAEQLRINVTSPGGTTAAALNVLMNDQSGLPPLLKNAITAAAERSRELSSI